MLYQLYYFLLLGIPLLLVIGAVALDWRTRRGYGLALLAGVLLGLTIWLSMAFEQTMQRAPSSEQFGVIVVVGVYSLIGCYCALVLWVGALVEAGRARQWCWIAGLLVAVLVPGLNFWENTRLHLSAQQTPISGWADFLLIILLPTLVVLIYGLFRIVRPGQPTSPATPPAVEAS